MSPDRKLPKANSLLPSFNFKQFISLIILLLVTSSTTQSPSAKYDCPSGCECNATTLSAKCDDLDELIESYSRKQNSNNLMPIQSLDLSNNQLTKLTNQLELLTNLTELNLSHNQLTQVQKLNFVGLEKLDLSYNRITSAKLRKLPRNVIHLNLSHNEITYLPVDFMKLKALRSLELTGNPLNCTCNTLQVRNWLTYHHVWTDNHIICASPIIVKGQPWLQARQNDICIVPSSTTTTQRSKYNWDNYEDDNEIMMGDQPQADQADDDDDVEYEEEQDDVSEDTPIDDEEKSETKDPFADENEKPETDYDEDKPEEKEKSDDDLDEEFIAVSQEPEHIDGSTVEPEAVSKHVTELTDEDEEGSGGEIVAQVSEQPEEDTDESGSGIPLLIPLVHKDDLESSSETEPDVVPSLGIFEDNTEAPIGAHTDVLKNPDVETEPINKDSASQSQDLKTASTEDNTGTYVFLGILALCLISLMIFVAMKNRQEKNRNRRYDVEKNGATELQDMDKRLLGKPLDRNGNDNGNGKAEQAPLINDYPVHKDERPAAYTSFHPPEITVEQPTAAPREKDKSQQSLYENLPNENGSVEPVNGTRTPDSDEEVFHPASEVPASPESLNVSPEAPKRYSPIYTPASPRSERYSPVYSPETGRVKIKLTETPKPKTPVVVTRSRSRAGEYINTPN